MASLPILTVGIPAYNRTTNLERLIEQFAKEDLSLFRLLICDDASPDDPTAMVNKFRSDLPNLTYIRNKKNLGFSANVRQLYDKTDTQYIWFMCDDDKLIPGAVRNIVDSLKEHDPTVAVFNHTWTNPYGIVGTAGISHDEIYTSESQIKDYSSIMRTTFLSSLVLKKIDNFNEITKTDFTNNVFVQISLSLLLLSKRFKFAQISKAVVERQVGFNYGEFFKFYMVDHLRSIFGIKHKLNSDKFIEYSIKEIPTAFKLYLSQKIGLFSYRGIPTWRTIKEIVTYYKFYSLLIFAFVPIYYLLPKSLLCKVYKAQLRDIHPKELAEKIFDQNINRAYKDNRKTGFTEYR